MRLAGYASAWQANEASWEALTVLLLGGTTMTGGPVGEHKGRGHLSPQSSQKPEFTSTVIPGPALWNTHSLSFSCPELFLCMCVCQVWVSIHLPSIPLICHISNHLCVSSPNLGTQYLTPGSPTSPTDDHPCTEWSFILWLQQFLLKNPQQLLSPTI